MKKIFTIAVMLMSLSCALAQQPVYFFSSDSYTPFANYTDVQRIEFCESGVNIVQNGTGSTTIDYGDFSYFGFNANSGIENVTTEIEAGTPTIYNTMGVNVGSDLDRLPNGIYIVIDKQTKTAKKIFKK